MFKVVPDLISKGLVVDVLSIKIIKVELVSDLFHMFRLELFTQTRQRSLYQPSTIPKGDFNTMFVPNSHANDTSTKFNKTVSIKVDITPLEQGFTKNCEVILGTIMGVQENLLRGYRLVVVQEIKERIDTILTVKILIRMLMGQNVILQTQTNCKGYLGATLFGFLV
jgi:hypothetical protein